MTSKKAKTLIDELNRKKQEKNDARKKSMAIIGPAGDGVGPTNLNPDNIVEIILYRKKGMTQAQIAEKYGVSQSTISNALKGLVNPGYTFKDQEMHETPLAAMSYAVKYLLSDRSEQQETENLKKDNESLRLRLEKAINDKKVARNEVYRLRRDNNDLRVKIKQIKEQKND